MNDSKTIKITVLPTGYAEGTDPAFTVGIRSKEERYYHVCEPAEMDADTLACRSLWRAVLAQMLVDAKSNSPKLEDQNAREIAKHFLFEDSYMYPAICSAAGFDPSIFRRKCMAARERGYAYNDNGGKR